MNDREKALRDKTIFVMMSLLIGVAMGGWITSFLR